MTTSYPSSVLTSINVPEVSKFTVDFQYNFFVSDEMVSSDGIVPNSESRIPGERFDTSFIDRVSRTVPRFVRFKFSPVNISQNVKHHNEFLGDTSQGQSVQLIPIASNLDKIISEDDFSDGRFVPLVFQDNGIDKKIFTLVSGSVSRRISAQNKETLSRVERLSRGLRSRIERSGRNRGSLLDLAKVLNEDTPEDVSPGFIESSLNQIENIGATFLDDDDQIQRIDSKFDRIKDVAIRSQINAKLVGTIARNAINSPSAILADELAPFLGTLESVQEASIARTDPGSLSENELESIVEPVFERSVDASEFQSSARIAGYLIEKNEILPDGSHVMHDPIVIEGQGSAAFDANIAYGRIYTYTIRAIAQVEIQAPVEESGEIVAATLLIASGKSAVRTVECVENVPPPAPADFSVTYDYQDRSARLMWSFPVNPQRDIKRFQIFRRRSVNEPFQLIREIDFDDSEIIAPRIETPNPELIDRPGGPLTLFLDREFKKDSRFIYAVASIDAHGLSSGYSVQFETWFDRFSNKLIKKRISRGGAPKSYPNLYLLEDVFADTIKTSGHSRLRIYFDPEALELTDRNGRDLRLISSDKNGGGYVFQIINTDLQRSQGLDILIQDRRTSEEG